MNPKELEKRIFDEFDDNLSNIFYTRPQSGAECTRNKQIIKDFISHALQLQKEEMIKQIENFSGRDDIEILNDLGKSAPYPAPCARKTCNILINLLKQ